MIIGKTPLRISLVGGSSDTQLYLDKYNVGGVISFPCDLYTYISFKALKYSSEYRVVYSKLETTKNYKNIKNDIAREVIKYFDLPPSEITFNCDIPSGSGLASSSSYLISFIHAASLFLDCKYSQYEICKIALELERKFNPLTGYQDCIGCGLGGLKKITFFKDGQMDFRYLTSSSLKRFIMYLLPTNILRNSTQILNTLEVDKIVDIFNDVEELENVLDEELKFCKIINNSWQMKKSTSPYIMNDELIKIENEIKNTVGVRAYKLCGAGGGGFFLCLCDKEIFEFELNAYRIHLNNKGTEAFYV